MKKEKLVRITVGMPQYLIDFLDQEAKERGISRSALVREIVGEYLERKRREEARFWDTHSPLDYPDEIKEVQAEVIMPLKHMQVMSVRVDEALIEQMKQVAIKKHIGITTLARMYIAEGLERESRTRKTS